MHSTVHTNDCRSKTIQPMTAVSTAYAVWLLGVMEIISRRNRLYEYDSPRTISNTDFKITVHH